MTQKMATVFSDSPGVIESVSEEKMNLYGSAHGRYLSSCSKDLDNAFQTVNKITRLIQKFQKILPISPLINHLIRPRLDYGDIISEVAFI